MISPRVRAPRARDARRSLSMSSMSPRSSRLSLLALTLIAACGGEQKPTTATADAKTADKAVAPPAADKQAAPAAADTKVLVKDGADPTDDRYTLRVEPPADAAAGREGTVKVTV